MSPHPTSWRSILVLSSHLRLGLPTVLFIWFPHQIPAYSSHFPHTCYIASHLILDSYRIISSGRRLYLWTNRNKVRLYVEELLAPRPTYKLEDHTLSAVCDCLFNTFAAPLHTGGCSSICNLRTRHSVVTWTYHGRDRVYTVPKSTKKRNNLGKMRFIISVTETDLVTITPITLTARNSLRQDKVNIKCLVYNSLGIPPYL